jgi:hypothetical protein
MEYTATGPDGNDYTITGPAGASDAEVIAQIQQAISPGALESFGRGAVNNIPLGQQAAALLTPGKDYSTALQDLNTGAASAKASHPIAYGAGAVTGAVAPLALPGVGEALTGEAAIPANAALGAANAVSNTDLANNPEEAAKKAISGGLVGGAIGAVMPDVSKAQEGLEDIANSKTVQATGIAPGNLGVPSSQVQDMGSMIHELGADTGELEDRFNTIHEARQQVGKQIEDLGQGTHLEDPTPFVQAIQDHMRESTWTLGAEGNPELKMYQQALARVTPNTPFETLQELKNTYSNRAFDKFGNIKPNGEVPYNIYKAISDTMDQMTSSNPEYAELKHSYSTLSDIEDGLQRQYQKEQAGGLQAKGFGLAGKLAAMVTGGNVPATVGVGAALAPAHPFMAMGALSGLATNPGAIAGAARGAAEALPTAVAGAGMASTDALVSHFISNPQSYGKFSAPLMQALQQGGKQGFAATSFVLRQQHPELNQMMLDRASSMGPQDITNETQR